ncbi:maleylpyruvate isomerase family mycothiol-dependent enzyme [Nocardia sp. NPDC050799]|uniref:maleylpyruvate isomerase family mycothiol-dependent enzyme n=1 Tax=Nocardia sp. NPDC050799 TaxID=3154842 RepID=UPI0033F18A0F
MDIRGMLADERAEMTALLRDLSEAEWDAPTLCTGRRVRELVAHLRYDSISLAEYAGITVRHRFSIDGVNNAMAAVGAQRTPAQLPAEFAAAPGSVSRWWLRLGLADLFVHQQDIRRPLGRAREIPADRLRAVLDEVSEGWRSGRRGRYVDAHGRSEGGGTPAPTRSPARGGIRRGCSSPRQISTGSRGPVLRYGGGPRR